MMLSWRTKASCPVALIAMSLGGCDGNDAAIAAMQNNSHFEETGAGTYRFTAVMNAEYPADDPKAEALRQRWLDEDLVMSNQCSKGATPIYRKVIEKGRDPQTGAPTGVILYVGNCF
ncbi:MAG TPA: hypothetical protein VE397_06900 [Stellaceae bacterium]|nr:hypothetical protein [Stellaceae bacterium]